ncbi:MAG: radical SAM-associated putative lipoprotein [Bacteroidetes bacterium]|uniref:Radical SAM-associated putative lipoprotein n=1 Tax=Candidatus Cryptobacteroides merdavium TaxID=2840769 RepID=A0A9D9EEQ4_9BACT|nr:radical SAM-associated putative lipoprotein [Candidatus Cryptobacteroides merdavium]
MIVTFLYRPFLRRLLKVVSAVVAALVFLPMLSSCEFSGSSAPGGRYDLPYADFEISGTVIDDLGQPVQGIRVYYVDPIYGSWYYDTHPDGTFYLEGTFTPSSSIMLGTFDLGDGQNWYDYQDATLSVQLDLVEEPDDDDDAWFQGVYAAHNVQIQIFRNMDI